MDARYRILSLDGGGIRGLLTAVWLTRLEELLGGPLKDHFDMVAGTSTGSILACGVSQGIPAQDMVGMYELRGREIFPSKPARLWSRLTRLGADGPSAPKYDGQGLQRVLRSVFGDTTFGELAIKPTLVTSYDVLSRQATVFKNTKQEHAELPVWEVAKCSSSAPTYFPAHGLRLGPAITPFIDGGVIANNPTVCAIAEARRDKVENLDQLVVVSMGTGQQTRPIDLDDAQEWGALEWAIPIIDVLFDGAADATEYIAKHLLHEHRYFRLQCPLHEAYDDMDNADASNLNNLKSVARNHLSQGGDEQLRRAAELLK